MASSPDPSPSLARSLALYKRLSNVCGCLLVSACATPLHSPYSIAPRLSLSPRTLPFPVLPPSLAAALSGLVAQCCGRIPFPQNLPTPSPCLCVVFSPFFQCLCERVMPCVLCARAMWGEDGRGRGRRRGARASRRDAGAVCACVMGGGGLCFAPATALFCFLSSAWGTSRDSTVDCEERVRRRNSNSGHQGNRAASATPRTCTRLRTNKHAHTPLLQAFRRAHDTHAHKQNGSRCRDADVAMDKLVAARSRAVSVPQDAV